MSGNAKLRVEGLAFGYGNEVSSTISPSRCTPKSIFAIMGGSGSGKSTLMRR